MAAYFPPQGPSSKALRAASAGLQPAVLLAPAVVRDLGDADRAHRVRHALPLRNQHIHLAQLRNNLLRLVSFPRHRIRPSSALSSHTSGRTTSKGEDHDRLRARHLVTHLDPHEPASYAGFWVTEAVRRRGDLGAR